MTEKETPAVDVKNISFDENGEVVGLDDAALDEVAGGVDSASQNKGVANGSQCFCS